ncbi:MAG: YidC/Oxa1 family membrane protein insertase [Candidatus Liptonbacteria bacterium]|nr:YidC/Oxa1 family membrane protein insertase [Candidatus Liptonbacteria bacterium]
MEYLYNTFLYHPFLNALVLLYNTVAFQDLGIAIIFLTILIRVVLFPLFQKSVRHQAVMQRLQPEIKKIQVKYPKDREQQAKEMLALYKSHQLNPFSGFFLLLIQLPVLIALYQVFVSISDPQTLAHGIYPFVQIPAELKATFLGLINLKAQSIFMVGLAAFAQYLQGRAALPPHAPGDSLSDAERMGRNMVYIAPILTLLIFWSFPAAVSLYWLVSSMVSIGQQVIVNRELRIKQ